MHRRYVQRLVLAHLRARHTRPILLQEFTCPSLSRTHITRTNVACSPFATDRLFRRERSSRIEFTDSMNHACLPAFKYTARNFPFRTRMSSQGWHTYTCMHTPTPTFWCMCMEYVYVLVYLGVCKPTRKCPLTQGNMADRFVRLRYGAQYFQTNRPVSRAGLDLGFTLIL